MQAGHLAVVLCFALACNGANPSPKSGKEPPGPRAPEPAVSAAPPANAVGRPRGEPQPPLPMGSVELEAPPKAPVRVRVEVATEPGQQQMGLMFREHLDEDAGMLFVFPTERRNSFWMRNTLLPLDMFFIDSQWNVVGVVENATPLTDDPRNVPLMSQYVLEVNAGFARKHGFSAGAKVRYTPPGEVQ